MTDLAIPSLQRTIEGRRDRLRGHLAQLRFELRAWLDPRAYIRAHARAAVLTAFTVGLVAGYVWWNRRR